MKIYFKGLLLSCYRVSPSESLWTIQSEPMSASGSDFVSSIAFNPAFNSFVATESAATGPTRIFRTQYTGGGTISGWSSVATVNDATGAGPEVFYQLTPSGVCSGRFILAGQETSGSPNGIIIFSDDGGVSWQNVTNPGTGLDYRYWDFACHPSGSVAVLVGDYQSSPSVHDSRILTSSNYGSTWSETYAPSNNKPLYGVAYGNDLLVAVGGDSNASLIILTSPDGTTWTDQTPVGATADFYNDITYANGKFVIDGGNVFVTSTDGVTWTEESIVTHGASVTTTYTLTSSESGKVVAVGEPGVSVFSSDSATFDYSPTLISEFMGEICLAGDLIVSGSAESANIFSTPSGDAYNSYPLTYNADVMSADGTVIRDVQDPSYPATNFYKLTGSNWVYQSQDTESPSQTYYTNTISYDGSKTTFTTSGTTATIRKWDGSSWSTEFSTTASLSPYRNGDFTISANGLVASLKLLNGDVQVYTKQSGSWAAATLINTGDFGANATTLSSDGGYLIVGTTTYHSNNQTPSRTNVLGNINNVYPMKVYKSTDFLNWTFDTDLYLADRVSGDVFIKAADDGAFLADFTKLFATNLSNGDNSSLLPQTTYLLTQNSGVWQSPIKLTYGSYLDLSQDASRIVAFPSITQDDTTLHSIAEFFTNVSGTYKCQTFTVDDGGDIQKDATHSFPYGMKYDGSYGLVGTYADTRVTYYPSSQPADTTVSAPGSISSTIDYYDSAGPGKNYASINLSWDAVSGAYKYGIYQKVNDGSYILSDVSYTNSYEAVSRIRGRTHDFKVSAFSSTGIESSLSSAATVPLTALSALAPPTLNTPTVGVNSFELTADTVGGATGVIFSVRSTEIPYPMHFGYARYGLIQPYAGTPSNTAEYYGVMDNASFFVSVASYDASGFYGDFSSEITVTTNTLAGSPIAGPSFTVTSPSSGQVDVEIAPVAGAIAYCIAFVQSNLADWTPIFVNGESQIFNGQTSGVTIDVYVASLDLTNGLSEFTTHTVVVS